MALIRNQDAANLVRDAIVLDLGDISRQGEILKKKARADAAKIVQNATTEASRCTELAAEQGHDSGYKKGLDLGVKKGTKQGRDQAFAQHSEQINQLLRQWQNALGEFQEAREGLLVDARLDVLRFAITVAEMLVYRVIQVDPTVIEDQVGEALRLISKRTAVRVRINPDDVDLVRQALPNLVAQIANCDHAAVVPDAGLSRGGCIIQGDGGEIDASIETQMDRIIDALLPTSSDAAPEANHAVDPGPNTDSPPAPPPTTPEEPTAS